MQTEAPYWLDEAYEKAINDGDIGLVQRNLIFSKLTHAVISTFFDSEKKFLDYGGGYGLFVRLMRDKGFDFYRHDLFCQNLFAETFEAKISADSSFALMTAFEVFEHLVNPQQEIEQMAAVSRNILFSTILLPTPAPLPEQWWYFGLDHGQHVSLYTLKSLRIIADKLGLNLYSNGASFHLLTEKKISNTLFKLVTRQKIATMLLTFMHKPSLIEKDRQVALLHTN